METATFPTQIDAQIMEVDRHLRARAQAGQDWVYVSGQICGKSTREFYRGLGYLVRCNSAPGDPSGYRVLLVPKHAAAQHYQ